MPSPRLNSLFKKPMTRKEFLGLSVFALASIFGIVGIIEELTSHAATPFLSEEAESGTVKTPATIISDTAASGGKAIKFAAAAVTAGNFTPNWSDEFTGTTLSTATDTGGGNWRFNGAGQNGGYTDAAALSWDVTPAQGTQYGVISVQDSALRIKCMRNPGITGVKNAWIGASLCSNFNQSPPLQWIYGYFEFRARIPNPARGMFPALWFYNNNAPSGKNIAEFDLLEIFGQPTGQPYAGGLHGPVQNYNINTSSVDTAGWHRYAMDWQADHITYYRDGAVMGTATGSTATWFNGINMGIRIDYVMDPSFATNPGPTVSTTTDPAIGTMPYMDVDYVRYYKTMPIGLPMGSDDPIGS
jgi:beta-glucanase (GH16 family)